MFKISEILTGHMQKFFSAISWKFRLKKFARIFMAACQGFSDDDCSLKASALTYYSILSIVPVLAVAFGIAKGFGFEKHLEKEVTQKFFEQKELAETIINFAYSALQGAQGGVIAGVGVIVLFWTVIKLLHNIESSFNAIWKVKTPRSLARRFNDYLALIIFCPLFFATSSSLSIFIVTQVSSYSQSHGLWDTVSPLITLTFQLFPLVLSWLLFTALYLVMPNTKVPIWCAVFSGILAGTAFQIVQWIYINFQLGITSYGAIYGSFAALPLLILWINISWLITLAGAEIAYHAENDISLSKLEIAQKHCLVDERIIGLTLIGHCIEAFYNNLPPLTIYDIAHAIGINVVTVRRIVEQLKNNRILSEVKWNKNADVAYQPGRDVNNITVKMVCDALNDSCHTFHTAICDKYVRLFQAKLENLDKVIAQTPDNTLVDLLDISKDNEAINLESPFKDDQESNHNNHNSKQP